MLKKTIIAVCITIVMVLGMTGCKGKKAEKINANHYAGPLMAYVHYSGRVFDRVAEELQRDLDLDLEQTQILFLMKSDLLEKVPTVRTMAQEAQVKMLSLLEQDTISSQDVADLLAGCDIYNTVLRDTVAVRLVELHSTLTEKQKEKLASYLDKGKVFPLPAAKPVSADMYAINRRTIQLYRDLDLTREQIRFEIDFVREMKKLLKSKMKIYKDEAIVRKEALKKLILAESITLSDIDKLYQEQIDLFADLKDKTTLNLADFHGMLTVNQRNTLAGYIADFEL